MRAWIIVLAAGGTLLDASIGFTQLGIQPDRERRTCRLCLQG
jgi:hypothetical protein